MALRALLLGTALAVASPSPAMAASFDHLAIGIPSVCVKLPWQKKPCDDKDSLLYATKNAPKEIRREIERLGLAVDAASNNRRSSWKNYLDKIKTCARGKSYMPVECTNGAPDLKALEQVEIDAWVSLYYFAKQYPNFVQPRQLTKILTWGEAVLRCRPNCKFDYSE